MDNQSTDSAVVEPPFELRRPSPARFRVLIVEDNPHIIDMYSYVVRKLATVDFGGKIPIDADFAADGHRALHALAHGEFHVVVTDLYMPVMDGFNLVQKIRGESRFSGTKVLAISGGGKDARERALALGVDVFLRKPVQFETLQRTLTELLRVH